MKKIYLLLGMVLLMMSLAFAQGQPSAEDVFVLGATITSPIAPSTSGGTCDPPELRANTCNGDIHHYEICIKTASGGKWVARSENCKLDYGDHVECFMGKCQKKEEKSKSIMYLAVAIGVIVIAFSLGRKKK